MHERKNLCCLCKNLFFIFYFGGIICRFPLSKIDWDTPLTNKLVFKKLILQFFNHCFIISFIKLVAMIVLQILKSIKNFLFSILLSVNKRSNA